MPSYLIRAKDSRGRSVVKRIDAENMDAAKYALEIRGFTDIVLQTDDVVAAVHSAYRAEGIETPVVPPDLALAIRETTRPELSFRRALGKVLVIGGAALLPFLAWGVWNVRHGRDFGPLPFIGVTVVAATAVSMGRYKLIQVLFDRLIHAYEWAKWEDMARCARILKLIPTGAGRAIPTSLLDFYEAKTLAARKRLPEALALVAPYRDGKAMQPWMFCLQTAILYELARDYDTMIAFDRQAIEIGPKGSSEYITLAQHLISRKKDVAGAREALAVAETKERVPLAETYVLFCKGMIALEEQNAAAAAEFLVSALRQSGPFASKMGSTIRTIQAYLGVALGALGRRDDAGRCLHEVEDYLKAAEETDLLARLRAASSGAPSSERRMR